MGFIEHAPYWLCPPGEGVYTVHTGSDKRKSLQAALYTGDPKESWLQSLKNIPAKSVCLLGVASDCGGGIQRGANWGPLYIREALLQDGPMELFDLGDVRVIPHLLHDKYLNPETLRSCRKALYGNESSNWPVSPLSLAESILLDFYQAHPASRVLGLGGDHSVSYALVRGWAKASARKGKRLGLLHFDAHTDLLSERLGVDICFGSWTYHVREFFKGPDQLIQVGIRSTGKEKAHWEKTLGLTQYWARDIVSQNANDVADKIIAQYKKAGIDELYISFDIDALDTKWAQATGTPEDQGLDPVFCTQIISKVAEAFPVTAADLVEVAPLVNHNFFPNNSQEGTLMTAASMARSLAQALKHA